MASLGLLLLLSFVADLSSRDGQGAEKEDRIYGHPHRPDFLGGGDLLRCRRLPLAVAETFCFVPRQTSMPLAGAPLCHLAESKNSNQHLGEEMSECPTGVLG